MGSPLACAVDYARLLKNMHYEIELQFPYYRSTPSARNDWAKLLKRFSCEGSGFLTVTLPDLGKAMIRSFQTGHFACPIAFKKQSGSVLPMFYNGVFNRIYKPNGVIRDVPSKSAMRVLNQLFFMFYKLELPYTEKQKGRIMDNYHKAEYDNKKLFLAESNVILSKAREIITEMFKDFDPSDISPNISNGALATGEIGAQKYRASRHYEKIHNFYPYYRYFVPTPNALCDGLKAGSPALLHWYKGLDSQKSGVSKMCFVPKDSRGPRTISMEPAEYMYIQQGLKDSFVKHLEKVTSHQINFLDQSYNQIAALKASVDGTLATYDFSAASDRVTVLLVDVLFRDVPRVLAALHAVRTTHTLTPDGEVLRLYKYAPMGSAMCFPVMATIIYAIAKAHNRKLPVLVYGDDLIVEDDSSYRDLVSNFESLGLRINRDKSFTHGRFRESCGTDAYDGYIITPIRLKKELQCKTPESFAALVDSSNEFYKAGYWHLAGCLREIIQINANVEVPTSSVHQEIDGLSFSYATDATDNTRIAFSNSELKYQKKVLSLVVPKKETELRDEFGYLMGLLNTESFANVKTAYESSIFDRGLGDKPSTTMIRDTAQSAHLCFEWKDMYCTCDRWFCAA